MPKTKTILSAKLNPAKCNPDFPNIASICNTFGIDPKLAKKGYQWKAGIVDACRDITLWWPAEENERWENHLSSDGQEFQSRDRENAFDLGPIQESAEKKERKAIFFRPKNAPYGYRFVGVFQTNVEKSQNKMWHVLDRVEDKIELP